MSRIFLRNGDRCAHHLFLRHSGSNLSDSLGNNGLTSYGRCNLLFSKAKPSSPSSFNLSSFSFSSSSSSSSTKNGFIRWYLGMIESRPILTKSLTAGVIFSTADISSQVITVKPSDSLDLIRTLRMAGYGMFVSGPSLHLWFNFVSRILPKRDILATFKKMFLGQAVYGPIMTVVFFSLNAAVQGETTAEIFARLKRDFIPTTKSCLVYWPMCDFVTFKFVPVHLQPLVSNSFSYLWTIYITYMASLQKASVEAITADS